MEVTAFRALSSPGRALPGAGRSGAGNDDPTASRRFDHPTPARVCPPRRRSTYVEGIATTDVINTTTHAREVFRVDERLCAGAVGHDELVVRGLEVGRVWRDERGEHANRRGADCRSAAEAATTPPECRCGTKGGLLPAGPSRRCSARRYRRSPRLLCGCLVPGEIGDRSVSEREGRGGVGGHDDRFGPAPAATATPARASAAQGPRLRQPGQVVRGVSRT